MAPTTTLLTRAARVARSLANDRTRYPALRLRPATERSAAGALAELGFPEEALRSLEYEYERARADVFPILLERAREAGADVPARKLVEPDHPSHEAKRLLYLAVRILRPETVVETGTFNGTFSTFILLALRDNGAGRLVSLDLPAYEPIPNAIDHPLPPGRQPGWLIPDALRERFELVLGDARTTLPGVLARSAVDLFLHDSVHTTRHMLFEYRAAWRALREGGLLVSDDIFMTPAFWWFTRGRRVPFVHVGTMGLTRKPSASGPQRAA